MEIVRRRLLFSVFGFLIFIDSYRRTYIPETYHIAQEIQKYNSAPKTDRFAPTMCSQMAVPDSKTVPVGLPCAMVQGCCKSMYPVGFPYGFFFGGGVRWSC